jgi:hypothetical protein
MTVRDKLDIAAHAVVIVNSDHADSQTIADRYCAMYGIPTTNQFVYALGSSVTWAYSAGRLAGFWADLYAKVVAVDAYAVFVTAGCPVKMEFRDTTDTSSVNANFAHMVGLVKRIIAQNAEPLMLSAGDGYYPMRAADTLYSFCDSVASHKGSPATGYDVTAVTTALEVVDDSDWIAAGGGTETSDKFTQFKSSWSGDYSIMDNLLTGVIGYCTHEDASHAATTTLWDNSRTLLGKAGNFQIPASLQSARKVLVAVTSLDNDWGTIHKQSLMGKKLIDLGLDVDYWHSATPTGIAEDLLPAAGGLGWTNATLDAGTATPTVTFQIGLGTGFQNGKQSTWAGDMTGSTSGGLFLGGASYGSRWAASLRAAGFSAISHTGTNEGGFHQTAKVQSKYLDAFLALLAGRTLCEAAWCTLEYTHIATGDPLMRPFPQ